MKFWSEREWGKVSVKEREGDQKGKSFEKRVEERLKGKRGMFYRKVREGNSMLEWKEEKDEGIDNTSEREEERLQERLKQI